MSVTSGLVRGSETEDDTAVSWTNEQTESDSESLPYLEPADEEREESAHRDVRGEEHAGQPDVATLEFQDISDLPSYFGPEQDQPRTPCESLDTLPLRQT
jgi:hypothetical protein